MNLLKKVFVFSPLLLSLSGTVNAASNGEWRYGMGAEYSSGEYGTSTTTEIWYFPFSLKHVTEQTEFSVTVPLLRVEGSGEVVPSDGGGRGRGARRNANASGTTQTRTESGIGDVVVSGAVQLTPETQTRPRLEIMGKVKLGTADEDKNLGTGENDYSVQLNLDKKIGTELVFGSAGYKVVGDPAGVDYRNVIFGSIGAQRGFANNLAAGAELYLQQATVSGTDGPAEITVYLARTQNRTQRLTGYLRLGLSDGSPDEAIGVSYSQPL